MPFQCNTKLCKKTAANHFVAPKRKLRQQSTGSWNHHAEVYQTKFAVPRMLFVYYPSDAYESLMQKLASEQRTSSMRCKVIERVWALKYTTVFPRGKQNDAVKWSSMRFASSIKTNASYTCWLCSSALCLVMASTNQKKKTAGQALLEQSHCESDSSMDRPIISSQPRLVLQCLPISVSCRGYIGRSSISFWWNIVLSKKGQWSPIMSLQEKAKVAFNWILESQCSALSNKVYSDQNFYFCAILLMHNKV